MDDCNDIKDRISILKSELTELHAVQMNINTQIKTRQDDKQWLTRAMTKKMHTRTRMCEIEKKIQVLRDFLNQNKTRLSRENRIMKEFITANHSKEVLDDLLAK
jgi:hypothetical protein